jgi:hypothetical protein
MDKQTMDIYLIAGCKQSPKVSGSATPLFGGASDPAMLSRLLAERPGFLGVNLNAHDAADALLRLKQSGARGMVVAAGYRTGGLRMEDALPIAEDYLAALVAQRYPAVPFEGIRFVREEALWWTFARSSEALIGQGYVPGALFAAIDKLDGHVWTEDEQAAFLAPS